jgi:hypothetical protein
MHFQILLFLFIYIGDSVRPLWNLRISKTENKSQNNNPILKNSIQDNNQNNSQNYGNMDKSVGSGIITLSRYMYFFCI